MEFDIKQFRWLAVALGLFLLSMGPVATGAAQGSKELQLTQKMQELRDLHFRVAERIREAMEIRAEFVSFRRSYADEIKDAQERYHFMTVQQATDNLRVKYNLLLIQLLQQYISELDTKIETFRDGTENLKFLYRQAEDESKILKTLSDTPVDGLMQEIDRLVEQIEEQIEKDLIEKSGHKTSSPPVDAIWQDICSGNL